MPKTDRELLAECVVTTFRSSGPGGQHRNVTESAVRLRHRPTGIVVTCSASRSQHRNKSEALEVLRRRIAARRKRRKRRVRTAPTKTSVEKRLESKKRRARSKKLRGKVVGEEGGR